MHLKCVLVSDRWYPIEELSYLIETFRSTQNSTGSRRDTYILPLVMSSWKQRDQGYERDYTGDRECNIFTVRPESIQKIVNASIVKSISKNNI